MAPRIIRIVTRYNRIYGSTTFIDEDNTAHDSSRLADAVTVDRRQVRESVEVTGRLFQDVDILSSHGKVLKSLKHVTGVHPESVWGVSPEMHSDLVCLFTESAINASRGCGSQFYHIIALPGRKGIERRRTNVTGPKKEGDLKAWKKYLIQFLKGSPSRERKLFRWNVFGTRWRRGVSGGAELVTEEGEL